MSSRKFHLTKLCLLFLSASLVAQEKQVMNIRQMITFALSNNFEIKEADIAKQQSEQNIKEVRGSGLPQVKSEIDFKDYLTLPTTIFPGDKLGMEQDLEVSIGKKYNADASVQVSQLLFSLKYINGLKTAKKVSEIRTLEVENAQIETVHLLLTEYYNLLAIYKNLEIIESNMTSLDEMRNKISALVEGGVALKTDLDKIEVNYANLLASKEQVTAAINVQTNNLKYIMGMDGGTTLAVDTSNLYQTFNDIELIKSGDEDFSFENLTKVKMLDKSLELQELQIKNEQSEKTPTVALYGSYIQQAMRDEFDLFDGSKDWYPVKVVGVKATIPIFSGFSNQAKIKSAQLEKQLTESQKQHVLTGLKLQYSNALMQYNASVKNCIIQHKNIDLAREVRLQEEVKYNEGMTTLTDVLSTENDLRNAEINYVQNYLITKQSIIDLLKAKGELLKYTAQNL